MDTEESLKKTMMHIFSFFQYGGLSQRHVWQSAPCENPLCLYINIINNFHNGPDVCRDNSKI
jgi:hypothetical protein